MFFTKSFATLVVFSTCAVARISSSTGAGAVVRFSNSAIGQDNTSSQPAFTSCSIVVSSVPYLSSNILNTTKDFQLAEWNLLKNEYPQSFADEVFGVLNNAIKPNGNGTSTATTVFIIGGVTNANLTSFVQSWGGLTANGTKASNNDAIIGNTNGSYKVTSSLQVGNITSDELIPFANLCIDKTISGEEVQWFIEVGSCVVQQD
ncbi:hypothetical protein GYMLUDRAFT_250786 [Collybiopsis luxurians FD-317 M1]|uniref:Uncharacterized protein n=1 Tax=Collybiopsis luxurians FD-317 M1 TaxID=944289 RepID=A0A0D0BED5_9AGAR|nr:hypothetical protein GYMLUDRAFT_250786 [Collybiopsis luxurians FD-317 M1]